MGDGASSASTPGKKWWGPFGPRPVAQARASGQVSGAEDAREVEGGLAAGSSMGSSAGSGRSAGTWVSRLFGSGDRSTPMATLLRQPLPVYHSRLLREDKAALVRLR